MTGQRETRKDSTRVKTIESRILRWEWGTQIREKENRHLGAAFNAAALKIAQWPNRDAGSFDPTHAAAVGSTVLDIQWSRTVSWPKKPQLSNA